MTSPGISSIRLETMYDARVFVSDKSPPVARRLYGRTRSDTTGGFGERFEIGRILHLKSEIGNLKADSATPEAQAVQPDVSDFGFEMQDSSNFEICLIFSSSLIMKKHQMLIGGEWHAPATGE